MVAAPYRRFAQDSLTDGVPYSDRRIEHALNPASRRPREHAMSGHRTTTSESHPGPDTATDVVRWAVFSCVLVPVVLLWYGTSLAGATGTALGLAAVTAACRVLLRRSERSTVRLLAEEQPPHRGHRHRAGAGAHRGGRRAGGSTPVD